MLYTRDRTETDVAGLAGPDGRLRRLPRPQVRPAHAARVLRAGGVLQQHDAERDGRQHQGHAARSSSCRSRRTGRAGTRCQASWPRRSSRSTPRKTAARAEFDNWLAHGQAGRRRGRSCRTTAWRFTPRSTKARATCSRVESTGKPRTSTLTGDAAWDAGATARQGASRSSRARRSKLPDAGDFEQDQPFTVRRLGQAAAQRRLPARSSPAWTTPTTTAAGTCGSKDGRVGTHIINKWPDDALKVVAQDAAASRTSGTTSPSPTTARGKAAGVQDLRQRRAAARRRRRPTRSTSTIRTDGAAQDRPAAHGVAARRASRCRTCGSTAGRSPPARSTQLAGATRAAELLAKPADKRTPSRDRRAVRLVAGDARRRRTRSSTRKSRALEQEEAAIKPRGTIAHVMQEKPDDADGLHPVPRRVRQAPRPGERRTRPPSLPPLPADLPRNRLGFAQVAAAARAPADGPRHGESLLAGSVRHRPRADGGRLRRQRASCRRTPSCSTGWPSSSASPAGT